MGFDFRRRLLLAPILVLTAACGGGDGGDLPLDAAASSVDAAADTPIRTCPLAPAEAEPNDGRDQAGKLPLGGAPLLGCLADKDDHDQYEVTIPADRTGGGVVVTLSEVGDGLAELAVFLVDDNGKVGEEVASSRGQSVSYHFAAAPGRRYRLDVSDGAGFDEAYTYKLRAVYTPVDDPFEPNDTRATAKAISVGTEVRAAAFAGYASGQEAPKVEAYDDWYSLSLQKGMTTVRLADVPADIAPDLKLYDGSGAELDHRLEFTMGAGLTLAKALAAAGSYFVKVGVSAGRPAAEGSGMALPAHFTERYRLLVTQP